MTHQRGGHSWAREQELLRSLQAALSQEPGQKALRGSSISPRRRMLRSPGREQCTSRSPCTSEVNAWLLPGPGEWFCLALLLAPSSTELEEHPAARGWEQRPLLPAGGGSEVFPSQLLPAVQPCATQGLCGAEQVPKLLPPWSPGASPAALGAVGGCRQCPQCPRGSLQGLGSGGSSESRALAWCWQEWQCPGQGSSSSAGCWQPGESFPGGGNLPALSCAERAAG